MTLTISEEHLPITLTAAQMTDEEFVEFCSHYPDYFVEVTADGQVIIMPPNYSSTSVRGNNITRALGNWADADGRGIATESLYYQTEPADPRTRPGRQSSASIRKQPWNYEDSGGYVPSL